MKILITEFINKNSLDELNNTFEIKFDEKLWEKKEELKEIIKDYDGLIVRNKTQVNKDILSNANNLKFIGRFSIGKDNEIDGVSRTDGIEIYTGYINEDYEFGILIAQDDMNMATFDLDGVSLQAKKINQNFKLVPVKQIVENFLD